MELLVNHIRKNMREGLGTQRIQPATQAWYSRFAVSLAVR